MVHVKENLNPVFTTTQNRDRGKKKPSLQSTFGNGN